MSGRSTRSYIHTSIIGSKRKRRASPVVDLTDYPLLEEMECAAVAPLTTIEASSTNALEAALTIKCADGKPQEFPSCDIVFSLPLHRFEFREGRVEIDGFLVESCANMFLTPREVECSVCRILGLPYFPYRSPDRIAISLYHNSLIFPKSYQYFGSGLLSTIGNCTVGFHGV
ncbi:hypothetical protein LINPERPRIM_LOCUS23835 [Linum perenne]